MHEAYTHVKSFAAKTEDDKYVRGIDEVECRYRTYETYRECDGIFDRILCAVRLFGTEILTDHDGDCRAEAHHYDESQHIESYADTVCRNRRLTVEGNNPHHEHEGSAPYTHLKCAGDCDKNNIGQQFRLEFEMHGQSYGIGLI